MKGRIFTDTRAILATKHGKEQAVAPVFGQRLDLLVEPAKGLDTDQLGTFTGERKRVGDMKETVRLKADMALKNSDLNIAIATEGSFGPSPVFPSVPLHIECMIIKDRSSDFELLVFEESLDTNFDHMIISDIADVDGFLSKVGFPEHGLIMKPHFEDHKLPNADHIVKGVQDSETIEEQFSRLTAISPSGEVHIETDMRAHMNPTRMQVIHNLSEKMCDRLLTRCPSCSTPGWGMVDTEKGLPCEQCGYHTQMVRYVIYGCVKCDHEEKKGRPDGIAFATPGTCPNCNP